MAQYLSETIGCAGVIVFGIFLGLKAQWRARDWGFFAATVLGGIFAACFLMKLSTVDLASVTSALSSVAALLYLALALVIYFIPSIVAKASKHKHASAIFVANLFLGWTILGWILSLVWAAMSQED